MRPWSHWVSFGLSAASISIALLPRDYLPEHTGNASFRLLTWPKLVRFPIFWIGLLLLCLLAVHALNPSWKYESDGKVWWIQRIPHIEWLPSGVDVPLFRTGPWRMMVIYGSVWLTVCAIWVGFTRRRTIQWLTLAIAANAVLLGIVGVVQKASGTTKILWFFDLPPGSRFAMPFGPFVYKNHAGAFLFLSLVVTCGIAGWYYLRGLRRFEKSNPASLLGFAAACIAVAIIVSYSRGSTLTTIVFLLVACVLFFVRQFTAPSHLRSHWAVVIIALVLLGTVVRTSYEALRLGESWQRITRVLDGGDVSFRSRIVANQATADMLRDHWKFGIGAGGFQFLFPSYQQKYPEIWTFSWDPSRRQYWSHAHNDLLQLPLELGVPGMLLIAAGWLYWSTVLVRNYFWSDPLSLFIAFGVLLFTGYSYFDFLFYCPAVLMLWCCLWPIATIWARQEEKS